MYKKFTSLAILPHLFVFIIFSVFILLRLPSIIEPYWYGDEGIYAVIGQSMQEGNLLYKDIWDNKPPLLYVLYFFANGELILIKALSLIVGIFTILIFYRLSQFLLEDTKAIIISTVLFSFLFGLPLIEGNIANAENFMLLPIIGAFYIILKFNSTRAFFSAGLLFSVALMVKSVAVFDMAALMISIYLLSVSTKVGVITAFTNLISSKKIWLFVLGLVVLPAIVFFYYLHKSAVPDLISSIFVNNVGYVGVENHFIFPLGLVFIKVGLLVIALSLIYFYKNRLSVAELVLLPWMTLTVFSMFFSDRPYIHYVLMGIAPFSLLVGFLFKKPKIYLLILLSFIAVLVVSHFSLYNKNIAYYGNYYSYIFGNKSYREYIAFFDRNSVTDHDVAHAMKSILDEEEKVYYWSDSAQLYLLTDRMPFTQFIVAYHSLSYLPALVKTEQQVRKEAPRYIVSTRNTPIPFELENTYILKQVIDKARIYEKNI